MTRDYLRQFEGDPSGRGNDPAPFSHRSHDPPDVFKLCRMLRGHPDFRQTPILIITALDNTDSKIVAIGAGANNYFVKSFSAEDLVATLKDLLGG